jgi:hypothetical protein
MALVYEGNAIGLRNIQTVNARAFLDETWSPIISARFRLRADFDGDGLIGAADIDRLCAQIKANEYRPEFDLNDDQVIDRDDHDAMVRDVLQTTLGDANLDGVFDSSDFVLVFQRGHYENRLRGTAGWADGDWNCDGEFTSKDFVEVFAAGKYRA